ncbi:WxcM-like domain-containing protein [Amylibacter sp.]|jgi:hypothetical protein|nr:WxcM-like domain-containing protein [Amylibacter sp.]
MSSVSTICKIYPVDAERGGHANRELEQIVFALSGSFKVLIDNSHNLLFQRHFGANETGSDELYVYVDHARTHFEADRANFLSILEQEKRNA